MTCCRPPPGKKSASCSAVSDNLPYRTLERKEPAHDDCHRAPAPGSLHACFRKPEDEDRVAQRIADLEVAPGRDGDELLAVQLVHRGRRVDAGAAVELPQDGARLGVVRLEPAVALAGEHQAARRGGRAAIIGSSVFCCQAILLVFKSIALTRPYSPEYPPFSSGTRMNALPSHNRPFSHGA